MNLSGKVQGTERKDRIRAVARVFGNPFDLSFLLRQNMGEGEGVGELHRTPLYSLYRKHPDVRCIDLGGWEMPVQFSGIRREHDAVRKQG